MRNLIQALEVRLFRCRYRYRTRIITRKTPNHSDFASRIEVSILLGWISEFALPRMLTSQIGWATTTLPSGLARQAVP
jgi:hypothetical protein